MNFGKASKYILFHHPILQREEGLQGGVEGVEGAGMSRGSGRGMDAGRSRESGRGRCAGRGRELDNWFNCSSNDSQPFVTQSETQLETQPRISKPIKLPKNYKAMNKM